MKTIVEKPLGEDGAKAALVLADGYLEARVSYPLAKVADAVMKPLDPLREKLKNIIPGDWDNPIVDKIFDEAKEELTKLFTE